MIGRTNAAVGTVKNPYIAKSEAEMAKYCDAKYAGAFVKFLDPAYNFSVPKTFECGIFGTTSSGDMNAEIDFIFDNRRGIKEVEEILDNIVVENDQLLLFTTLTYVNGNNETVTCKIYGCKSSTTNAKSIYAEYLRNSKVDRYLMWQKGLTDINDSILTFFIDQGINYTDLSDVEKQELLKLIAPNEGWLYPLTDGFFNSNKDYMGITMFASTLVFYNENRNITITQMLPGAEKLYVMPGLSSKYLDGHCYRIEQTGVATKYSAASPFSIGDNLAGASFNINTALGVEEVVNILETVPWDDGMVSTHDGWYSYYNIFNNPPDFGESTYTGTGKFDESDQFFRGLMGIVFMKLVTDGVSYAIASMGYNGNKNFIWTNNPDFEGGGQIGWYSTSGVFAASWEGVTQDAKITQINNPDILNQLISKTTFNSEGIKPVYKAILYNEDGKASPLGVPVGAIYKSSDLEINSVLSQRENLGKIYKYCGYSQGKYITGNYYIVEEVTE